MLFGHRLVATPEDFGIQGRCRRTRCCSISWRRAFVPPGWNLKALHGPDRACRRRTGSRRSPTRAALESDPANEEDVHAARPTGWSPDQASPPPSTISFDAAERLFCTVSRQRTSTPLQSLVLLNDPQFVEAARALAAADDREDRPADERTRGRRVPR